jgi:hypothetical protein
MQMHSNEMLVLLLEKYKKTWKVEIIDLRTGIPNTKQIPNTNAQSCYIFSVEQFED